MLATDIRVSARPAGLFERLPPFSPVAVRLMAIMLDEDVSSKQVARLISLDPALSGEVLQLANSGAYGRREIIHSILHAVAYLGVHKINQIVITNAIWKALPRNPTPFVRAWWRHSIAAAFVAQRMSAEYPEMQWGYAGGLLHGVGQLALIQYAPGHYEQVLKTAYLAGADLLDCERQEFGVDHAELGELVLEGWKLPANLRNAVATHHSAQQPIALLNAAVHASCWAAEYAGFGTCGCHRSIAAGEIPELVTSLLDGKYLPEALVEEVNAIEYSLT